MFLIKLSDKAILSKDFEVVGFGDSDKIFQLGLNFSVPIFVIVQKLRVQIVTEQRAAGGADITVFIGFNGEDVAALFVAV